MKKTITYPDGTKVELEGTPEEIERAYPAPLYWPVINPIVTTPVVVPSPSNPPPWWNDWKITWGAGTLC